MYSSYKGAKAIHLASDVRKAGEKRRQISIMSISSSVCFCCLAAAVLQLSQAKKVMEAKLQEQTKRLSELQQALDKEVNLYQLLAVQQYHHTL